MKLIEKKKQNNEGNIQNDSLKNKNTKLFKKKLSTLQKRKITDISFFFIYITHLSLIRNLLKVLHI